MRKLLVLPALALLFAACSTPQRMFGSGGNGGNGGSSSTGALSSTGTGGGGSGGPACGNGVKEAGEQCDDGAALNTGAYGKCDADCTLGPRCGDGKINGPDEACDSGPDNGLGLGQCNPACSGTVVQKSIKRLTMFGAMNGNLTGDWDPFCQTQFGQKGTYKALLVDGKTRVASKTANLGDGQVDWVLKPYTRYVNDAAALLWTTDQVNLLGVRDGKAMPLLASFGGGGSDFAWAGFESDWTTSMFNCGQWNLASGGGGTVVGLGILGGITTTVSDCTIKNFLLCVEQ